MNILLKLTKANIKMYFRDRAALIWTLFFPFVIIAIFGVLDFAKFSTAKIGMSYTSETEEYAKGIKTALESIGDYYKIEEGDIETEKQALSDDDRLIVLEFKSNPETSKLDVTAYLNKSNEQSAQSVFLIIQKVLTDFEMKMNQIEPIFDVKSEVINVYGLRNIDYLVPGIIAMSLMQGGLFGVVGTIVTYREKGILKRLFATPLSKSNFLISQILSRLLISILQVMILLISSYLVFQINIVGNLLLVFLTAVLGSLVFLAMGFTISGVAKTEESARAIMMPIQMILMFTSGVYFSREVLPTWLYDITSYTPLTYLSDGLRDIMTRGHTLTDKNIQTAILGMFVWFILFVAVAIKTFKWEKKN